VHRYEAPAFVGRTRTLTIRLTAGLMVLAIVLAASFVASQIVFAFGNRMLERRYPPPGRMISVGSHKLHLFCLGEGRPTVIIEPGLGVDWVGWSAVIPGMSAITRVCVYDRGGYGWSEPGPFPRTAAQEAAELHALLSASDSVPGPYVLVAHSFGSHITRLFVSSHPDLVSGVLLLDPTEHNTPVPPDLPRRSRRSAFERLIRLLPPLGWRRLKALYRGEEGLPADIRKLPPAFRTRTIIASSLDQLAAERSELDSRAISESQVAGTRFPADVPLIVVTMPSSRPTQVRLAELSPRSRHVVARDSSHLIQRDQPKLVIELVDSLVASGRHAADAGRAP
jgi:pimeloyl-ACP methyl ester carboxylesterase